MSVKQDRTYTRTAADLERKYNFGKTFAEMLGLINDSRDHVDEVESNLRNEFTQEATSIRRDTQSIVLEAVKDTVKTSEFEEYKESASAELKVTADGINAKVDSTTEQVTNISGDLDTVKKEFEDYSAITDEFKQTVDTKLQETDEELAKFAEDIQSVVGDIQSVKDDLDVQVEVFQTFRQETESDLSVLDDKITAEVTTRTEEKTQIDAEITTMKGSIDDVNADIGEITDDIDGINTSIDGINTDIDGINGDISNVQADITVLKEFKNESSAKLDVLSDQITAEVSARTEESTTIKAEITAVKGDISDIDSELTGITEDITDINGNIDDINTDISGLNTDMADVKADITILEEYKDESTARLDVQEAQINAGVSRTEEVYTVVSGTIEDTKNELAEEIEIRKSFQSKAESDLELLSDSMTLSFEKTEQEISSINGVVSSHEEKLSKYFVFDDNGLTIKAGNGEMNLVLDNDVIKFVQNGRVFGSWDGDYFYTGNIVVRTEERAQFGNYGFIPRSNGSLDFKKVGE